MSKQILITGGAGFIGSHLADELLAHGYRVRALDNLTPQVHAERGEGIRPAYLSPEVDLVVGDVCDPDAVRRALEGVDAVFHLAAAVGVGQSMYQIARYTQTNNLGTAVLLEALIAQPVERLIVASSMSLYGEGLYQRADGCIVEGVARDLEALKAGDWEVRDADGAPLTPIPTPETKAPALQSVYALSKYDQERLCLLTGRAYGIPTVALRFFNTYGPRQALSNPYTGVLAIFASRLLNGNVPLINEDGEQRRDFVSVHDIARACRLGLEAQIEGVGDAVFNVGSGSQFTVREVADRLADTLRTELGVTLSSTAWQLTGSYRVGDIRHCFADSTRARQVLGYEPRVRFEDGLAELAEWLAEEVVPARGVFGSVPGVKDRVDEAQAELAARGLAIAATGHETTPGARLPGAALR